MTTDTEDREVPTCTVCGNQQISVDLIGRWHLVRGYWTDVEVAGEDTYCSECEDTVEWDWKPAR